MEDYFDYRCSRPLARADRMGCIRIAWSNRTGSNNADHIESNTHDVYHTRAKPNGFN